MNFFNVVQLLLWETSGKLYLVEFFFSFLELQKQFRPWPEFGVALSMTFSQFF